MTADPERSPRAIGEGTRILAAPSRFVADHLHRVMSDPDPLVFACLSKVNRAHVVMLEDAGIVSAEDASSILGALVELDRAGQDALSEDFRHGELFTHVERFVMEHAGAAVGGNLHIGRSRADVYVSTYRLYVRERLLEIMQSLAELRRTLVALAAGHIGTVIPSYTHGQQAQFITFAHYLSGALHAFETDASRVFDAFSRANRSPLGSAVGAGSSWPLDRALTARLLGFDAPIDGAFGAIYFQDYLVESTAVCLSIAANHLVLLLDLYTWCSAEFGFIEIDDEFCLTSSLMPQKKNPIGLEIIRSTWARTLGDYVELATIQRCDNIMERCIFGFQPARRSLRTTFDMLEFERAVLSTVRVDAVRTSEVARSSFAGAAELANVLVRTGQLSFRQAHDVVGTTVRLAFERGLEPSQVGALLVEEAARTSIVETIRIDDSAVAQALEPTAVLNGIRTQGGAHPAETERLLGELGERIDEDRARIEQISASVAQAETALGDRIARLLRRRP